MFANGVGGIVDHDNFISRIFKKDLKEVEMREIRFHDLRHSAITRMVRQGIAVPVVQKIAGHKDLKTTMRYVHVVADDIEEVGANTVIDFKSKKTFSKLKLVN